MAKIFEGRLCKNFTWREEGEKKKIKLRENFKLKPFRGVDMLMSLS